MLGSLLSTQSLMLRSFCSAPVANMASRGWQASASTASQCPAPSSSALSLPGIVCACCSAQAGYQDSLPDRIVSCLKCLSEVQLSAALSPCARIGACVLLPTCAALLALVEALTCLLSTGLCMLWHSGHLH